MVNLINISLPNISWERDFEFALQQYFILGKVEDVTDSLHFNKIESRYQDLVSYDEVSFQYVTP
jgi:hypothetical protein